MFNRLMTPILTVLFFAILTPAAMAVSLSDEVVQKLKEEGRLDQFVRTMADARSRGVDRPAALPDKGAGSLALGQQQTFRTLVILVDFPDKPYTYGYAAGTAADFDSLLFSVGKNPTGSLREYYFENSYGNLTVQGTVVGWYRAANPAAYYTNDCDGSHGMGNYPKNAQKLVEEAVDMANPDVDYSQFDNDGDGYVDAIFVIHAGTGYEETHQDCEIHSHQWGIDSRYRDGVYVSGYSIEPEETPTQMSISSIGVFCHEFGHSLGLPDMYDYDHTSAGVGHWELMGSGSYNGYSRTPAQLSAWSKWVLGWMNLTNVTANQTGVSIPAVEYTPTAYRLWRNGSVGNEYFIVENRQQMGFDSELPGNGLLIWHVNDDVWGNDDEWYPHIALEQADGKFNLQYGQNTGDGTDPYPNFGDAPYFHDKTTPNSKDYNTASTQVAVWDISPSDSVMTAGFDIVWSRPYLTMTGYTFDDATDGDGDGIPENGERIRLSFSVSCEWINAVGAVATLSIDDAGLPIVNGTSSMGTIPNGGTGNNNADPFVFDVPADYNGRIDSFFIQITSNGGVNTTTMRLEQGIGTARVLLIDDDNNDTLEYFYSTPMTQQRMRYDTRHKYSAGSPDSTLLNNYDAVFWFTGDNRTNPLAAADVTAMQGYLDGGGQLFLTGQGVAKQLSTLNPTFLADYLKAQYLSSAMIPVIVPEAGGPILSGFPYVIIQGYGGASNQTAPDHFSVLSGATSEGYYLTTTDRAALSYSGTYKLVFFGFGFEAIIAGDPDRAERDSVFNRIMEFFGVSGLTGYPSVPALTVGPGAAMNLLTATPDISWTYYDAGAAPQQAYRLQVGSDADWSIAEMWDLGTVSNSDTTVVYAGATLAEGRTYYLRVQVYNGTQWSNWRAAQFRLNTAPTVPGGLTPNNMAGVTSTTPQLQCGLAGDNENDVLTYTFQIFTDSDLTEPVQEVGVGASGSYVLCPIWPPLTDNLEYYWRVRADDGFEDGPWSPRASFWVNSPNGLPPAFALVSPPDDSLSLTQQPTLVWRPTTDPDLHDAVTYRVIWANNPAFTGADSVTALTDTTYTFATPLPLGAVYSWKIRACDQFGGVTTSAVYDIRLQLPGDANSDNFVDVGDAVYIINFVFKGGPAPEPLTAGDANGDCTINVGDAVYIINYLFKGGDAPVPGC